MDTYDLTYKPAKWSNAEADNLTALDKQIAEKTALRLTYQTTLDAIYAGLAKCRALTGLQTCLGKTGKTENNWIRDRDRYKGMIAGVDADLLKLQKLRLDIVAVTKSASEVKVAEQKVAEATNQANASAAAAGINVTLKYILIGVAVIAVAVGGYFMYKKFKK